MDDLLEWFKEADGFFQGTKAPHKWVLQAEQEITALRARLEAVEKERDALKVVQCWTAGEPPKYLRGEWFIAKSKHKDRVVLRALSEENSYDYTTADGTYIVAENVVAWMQFPDSNYISYVEGGEAASEAIARAERAEAALATARRDDLVRLRDAVEGAQHWLTVSLFTNAEHARAKEQIAYVIAEMDALIAHEEPTT